MPMDLKDKTEKNKHFITSLEFAIQGIKTVFQEERNMRAHVVFGLMAILVAFLLGVSVLECGRHGNRLPFSSNRQENQRYGCRSCFSDVSVCDNRWCDYLFTKNY